MATYKTPGVYVEEISTLPPSVAEVETAIPVFIGFTEKGISLIPKKITSLKEYEDFFGGADPETNISVLIEQTKEDGKDVEKVVDVSFKETSKNVMYYAMQLYYANGGGACFIISTGIFGPNTSGDLKGYTDAIAISSREDEPTLIVLPDAPFWLSAEQYYTAMNYAIQEATRLGDRFVIIDVIVDGDRESSLQLFRDKINSSESQHLKYGAAYFPYLNTELSYVYNYDEKNENDTTFNLVMPGNEANTLRVQATTEKAKTAHAKADNLKRLATKARNKANGMDPNDTNKKQADDDAAKAEADAAKADTEAQAADAEVAAQGGIVSKKKYKDLNDLSKNQIKKKISEKGVRLTPCSAIAGVYASVDKTRGVWKAPANVSLSFVKSTNVTITHDDQEDMNIDVNAGKSVNAIRPFIGKGILVWGARTLDGNSNEWRYVSVRRFFNMVEESIKKATYWAVFEPNDKNTWVLVRAMIENYLILKWRDGALAGAKPDDAFFVRVGLGQTMSPIDVLEGRMIIEIGLAAVRPAEFIIVKFSHKMQTT